MKTMLKVTFLFALVAFANTLFASGNLKVNMLPLKAERAVIDVSTLSISNFSMTIADEKEQIVYYHENLNPGENYRKVYDFSGLEDGTYQITVVSDDLTTERQFQKQQGVIKVGEEKTTIEPFFSFENGHLKCSYLNFSKEKLTLSVYGNEQLLYRKNIGSDFSVLQALNLSKLTKGNYEAVLYAGQKEYSYSIEIE